MKKPREPQTHAEWQDAVNTARLMRLIHDAALYGLVSAPAIDAARCDDILTRGRARGVLPVSDDELLRAMGGGSS